MAKDLSGVILRALPHLFLTEIKPPRLQRHFALIGRIPLLWSEIEFGITQVIAVFNRDSFFSKQQLWLVPGSATATARTCSKR